MDERNGKDADGLVKIAALIRDGLVQADICPPTAHVAGAISREELEKVAIYGVFDLTAIARIVIRSL